MCRDLARKEDVSGEGVMDGGRKAGGREGKKEVWKGGRKAGRKEGGNEPAVDVFRRRKDLLARLQLPLEEAFQAEEFFAGDFVLQHAQPAVVQRLNLELEEFLLLGIELRHPRLLVELDRLRLFGRRSIGWPVGICRGRCCVGLGRAEEGGDGLVGFGLLGGVGGQIDGLAFERHVCCDVAVCSVYLESTQHR